MKDVRQHFQSTGIATSVRILHALREHYPDHMVVPTPHSTGLLKLATARWTMDSNSEFYASRIYRESSKAANGVAGLKFDIQLAKYDYSWSSHRFIIYAAEYYEHESQYIDNHYILSHRVEADIVGGRSRVIDKLITAAALGETKIDDEIWVYDRGYWKKNRKLWKNVQACNWDQVILDSELKTNLTADVEGFFDRRDDYTSFGVPWKRGIILHGLPGNGKTISIKALMRFLACRSPQIPTLYVKSLGESTDQDDIRDIFEKARETAPCLIVFEDIDSLVTDKVNSFFLNEVNGMEGNDGIMMIGSTNYCKSKLTKKTPLKLPPEISSAIANITEGFSFAYLQEALVTALLGLIQTQRLNTTMQDSSEPASGNLEMNPIWQAIQKQVKILRKEMQSSRKSVEDSGKNSMLSDPKSGSSASAGFGTGR
ncbi:MAG: hypothetical protein Q9213_001569 [Squamulea squamosa]